MNADEKSKCSESGASTPERNDQGRTAEDFAILLKKVEREHHLSSVLETIPLWFAAIAGLVYAAGFLVEFTFFNTFGIKGAGGEAFKAKYIYIGILCLELPIILVVFILGLAKLRRSRNSGRAHASVTQIPGGTIVLLFNFLCTFYLLVAFARPNTFHERQVEIFVFFVVLLVGMVTVRVLEERIKPFGSDAEKFGWKVVCWVNWVLAATSLCLTIRILWGAWEMMGNMLIGGGYLYLGLMAMIALICFRISQRLPDYPKDARNAVIAIAGAFLIIPCYLSILVFASRVYPYIPARKGGGDYTTEKVSILTFVQGLSNAIPTQLVDPRTTGYTSKPVFVLRETPDYIYLCVTNTANGPEDWQKVGLTNKPREIITLKREAVVSIIEQEW